jgi:hypothetical protein
VETSLGEDILDVENIYNNTYIYITSHRRKMVDFFSSISYLFDGNIRSE